MAVYNPNHFALTGGAELSGDEGIPKLFGYYAEYHTYADIINLPTVPPNPPSGEEFFGLRNNGTGPVIDPVKALLPTATDQLSPGSMILIHGNHQTDTGAPTDDKYYILYVLVTSEPGFDTTYSQIYYYAEP